ncbi:MAG: putative zinc-binding protein [Pseudomonadota bacterium]
MSEECCSSNQKTMIVACSGASNVGQISNQVAVELTREGFGKMFCLAAVGAHINNFVFSAQNVDNLVAIDGCPVGCAMRLLEHAEVPVSNYLVVENLGIEKTADNLFAADDVEKVKAAVKGAGNCNSIMDVDAPGPCSCCA